MKPPRRLVSTIVALCAVPGAVAAQDTLRLGAAHADAIGMDPRTRQVALHAAASAVRMRTIRADLFPAIGIEGRAQYQSEVTRFPGAGPGFMVPALPHDTYDTYLTARQSLFDPTVSPRRAVERAQLEESQAQTRAILHALRQEINDAFFGAIVLQERMAATDLAITDLRSRLREIARRFAAGAALPGDTAALAATIGQREQDRMQLAADRNVALARLSILLARDVRAIAALAVPDLESVVRDAVATIDQQRRRPEYAQFDATRERLRRQEEATTAQLMPRLVTFARAGYAKPGLNALGREFQTYWLGGVQLQWAPWNWGSTSRERELLRIQREIVATNEAAFTASMRRALEQSIATIARLDSALVIDERVNALREIVEREAAAKLREGVITAGEYLDRSSELHAARVARIQHRVELAHARATFLTTLGVDLP